MAVTLIARIVDEMPITGDTVGLMNQTLRPPIRARAAAWAVRRGVTWMGIGVLWGLGAGGNAYAADVMFHYAGQITEAVDGAGYSTVSSLFDTDVDYPFSVRFTFDANPSVAEMMDTDPDPQIGSFAAAIKTVVVEIALENGGKFRAVGGSELVGNILILNDVAPVSGVGFIDEYVTDIDGVNTGFGPAAISLDLVAGHDGGAGPLSSDGLPQSTLPTGSWIHPNTFFAIDFFAVDANGFIMVEEDGQQVRALLGSLAAAPDLVGNPSFDAVFPSAVPLPAPVWLLLSALAVPSLLRRLHRPHPS